jgi:RND family efflux transporter MFP subunit
MSGYAQAVSALKSARQQRETTAQLLSEQLATRDQLAQADRAVNDAEVAVDAQRHEGGGETVRTLRAPFDGIVTNVPVAQGERVAADAALLTVAKSDGLIATVGVDPEAAARVQVGETVALERLTDSTPLQGRVIRVDGALNPKTRQVDVDVAVPVDAVISGEAVRAAVKVGETKGWVVPHRSVVTDSDQAVIYQVADDKAVSVDVTIASTSTETDVVRGALEATRPIIVDGAFQVQPGMRIRRSQP